jgi:hypothetical protein
MRPIRPQARPTLAALGICSALGLAAAPMAHVWLTPEPNSFPNYSNPACDLFSPSHLVVDLRDDVTESDIADIKRESGLKLEFASPFSASSDKIMEATVPALESANALSALRKDSRVEVVEKNITYTLPPNPFGDPQKSWEAAKAAARDEAAQHSSSPTGSSLLATISDPSDGTSSFTMECAGPESRFNSAFKPNDPRYGEQWNLQMVGAEEAWKKSRGKGRRCRDHRYRCRGGSHQKR